MIKNVQCCARIAVQNIKAWAQNYRMIMLLLLLYASISQFCSALNDFAASINAPTNALGILPSLYSEDKYFAIIIQLGIVLMFSNAPFKNGDSLYCVMRTGYTKWCVGQLLYIFAASFIYTASLFVITNLCCIRNLGYSLKWGKVFTTIRMSNGFKYMSNDNIQLKYAPLEALLHTLLLIFLLSVLFGLINFLMASVYGRSSGVFVTVALVLLGLMPYYVQSPGKIAKLSPCSLTQLYVVDKTGLSRNPSLAYAYTVLGILIIALLAGTIFVYSNKKTRHKIYAAEV